MCALYAHGLCEVDLQFKGNLWSMLGQNEKHIYKVYSLEKSSTQFRTQCFEFCKFTPTCGHLNILQLFICMNPPPVHETALKSLNFYETPWIPCCPLVLTHST